MNLITNNNLKSTIALAALQQVIDPEIGLNIVDLGWIYQIDFDERGQKIFMTMTLTTQFCPMGESITTGATNALQAAFEEYSIDVQLTFDPPWSHSLISAEGLDYLNQ